MWSDSFIGTVNPQTRMRSGWLFTAHNSLTHHLVSSGAGEVAGQFVHGALEAKFLLGGAAHGGPAVTPIGSLMVVGT
jgi:hypothetical protein